MYQVSSNPHIRDKATTASIMRDVIIALIPSALFGILAEWQHLISLWL